MKKTKYTIKGMHCKACASLVQKALEEKKGVTNAKVDFDSKKAVVIFDEAQIPESELVKAVTEAGDYSAEKIDDEEKEQPMHCEPKKASQNGGMSKGLLIFMIASAALNLYFLSGSLKTTNAVSNNKPEAPANTADLNPSGQKAPSANGGEIKNIVVKADDPIRGDKNAPVTLVEYSDFQCPYCGRHLPTLNKILEDYKGKVRLVYKHFPIEFHPFSQKAAEASECALEQGKFWEYHDKLFANQADFSVDKFKEWAGDLGLNKGQFNSCLDSDKYKAKVASDYQEGLQNGVDGTPSTFVNGKQVTGAQPYEVFKQAIDQTLKI